MYIGGKNSRKLHLDVSDNAGIQSYSIVPFDKIYVERNLLLTQKPEQFLSEADLDLVINWVIRRIGRTAFPDSFDQRWKARQSKIEKIFKRLELVEDIYIKLDPFLELNDDQEYVVELHFLMPAEHYDDRNTFEAYMKHMQALEDEFSLCPGINIEVIEIRSTAEITLNEVQEMSRWDYSYLSFRDPEVHVSASGHPL